MPVYEFKCSDCEALFEVACTIAERKLPRDCQECGSGNTEKIISHCSFVLKGDDWPGKNFKIKGQMASKNQRLDTKKRDMKGDGMIPKLTPNVDGEVVKDWGDAKRLAASKGKETTSYDNHIKKETEQKKGIIT